MTMGNPRDDTIWRPRTAEFMGGHKPREMGNYGDLDVNPNENADGLSHHTRQTPEDGESRDQRDPELRREGALRELIPALQHISVRPEDMDHAMERSPMMEQENQLLETGLGVDLGAAGLSESAGANVGTVRSTTPNITYGHPSRGRIRASIDEDIHDIFTVLKGRRKYKGRRYDPDEETEAEKKKSKKKRKRSSKGKRKGKKAGGKHKATGGRQPKSQAPRHAARRARELKLYSKRQAFAPNVRSLPLRMLGSTRSSNLPLRLRDPVAWERKKANQRARREEGVQPREHTHHRGAGGTGLSETRTRGTVIGNPMRQHGTGLPKTQGMGTSMRAGMAADRAHRQSFEEGFGDPLGTHDPLIMRSDTEIIKAKTFSRTELLHLKKKVEAILRQLNKLTKATPELGDNAKRGGQASPERSSDPAEKHFERKEDQAAFRFGDTSIMSEIGVVGKR